jgi:IS30 family transposase
MRKYQRLSNEQRQKLSFLLVEGRNQRQMAESLNVHQSTVSRELKRHRQKGGYNPTKAQLCCDAKRTAKRKRTVLTPKRKKRDPIPSCETLESRANCRSDEVRR